MRARYSRSGAGAEMPIQAGADGAEMVVGVDAGRVAVGKGDLDGVVPYLCGRLGAGFRFEHRKRGRRSKSRRGFGEGFLFGALIVAGGAGAVVAEISEVEMRDVAVRPGDVNASVCRDVDFD